MKSYKVLTIFPEFISQFSSFGVLSKAIEKGLLSIEAVNIRDFTTDKHQSVDDVQYGGGAGMLFKPEPICKALEKTGALKKVVEEDAQKYVKKGSSFVVLLDPRGQRLTQRVAEELVKHDDITFIAARYEGIDERVIDIACDMQLSIGDFILTGGELPACIAIDSVARLIPGVLGCGESFVEESFSLENCSLLEHSHYTRPISFNGVEVPEVLSSGNHARIKKWQIERALETTLKNRQDLLESAFSHGLFDKLKQFFNIKEIIKKTFVSSKPRKEIVTRKKNIYIALMHYPMVDKEGDVVATSITNLDLHDISRSVTTFDANGYYVITPILAQQEVASRVINHWIDGFGASYNANRRDAFAKTHIKSSLTEAIADIEATYGKRPLLVMTTARKGRENINITQLSFLSESEPILLAFGTGWGMHDDLLAMADFILEPIEGVGDFNHLSVRSAVAIYLDRLNKF